MKQTVEEAAFEYSRTWGKYNSYKEPNLTSLEFAFQYGADWQAKQSPWISVKERLPEEGQKVLVLIEYKGSMQIHEHVYWKIGRWVHGNSVVLAWFPIPSFDEILESNKDVLQRMKEKGC